MVFEPSGLAHRKESAGKLATQIAERLASPDDVLSLTKLAGDPSSVSLVWTASSLARGYPGIALLFLNRVGEDPANAAIGHQYLQRSVEALMNKEAADLGLLDDLCGLAFSLETGRQVTHGGYEKALETLNREIVARTKAMCEWIAAEPTGEVSRYDAISGLAGAGRYMLLRPERFEEDLRRVLDCLVVMADGMASINPGFWSPSTPEYYSTDPDLLNHGHLNLGLAHGIAGPLSLLSLAYKEGLDVPGQHEAAERIVSVYSERALHDEYGVFWPGYLSRRQWDTGIVTANRSRASWCYGLPGVARALQLAARHFDRNDWRQLAQGAIASCVQTPRASWQITDASLCHGWAGALHLLGLFQEDHTVPGIDELRAEVCGTILDEFKGDFPFGFRAPVVNHPEGADYPGLLEGAAGIALALDSYSHGTDSANTWGAALLVS
ncbi:lanthionine synthetase C family protein [Streptomyces sp. BPTC-684]|uniref:lanthionine synthetase C family protein n=1 Tax=Streptomyces sp. BPTC-684 TaxID=3043734 RepID=UPI0024B1AF18|nr:lanthionine synthetase C family protein [Streptomyces sp. BPTC-684]WHM36806.1 lanthionine synthetase C family protein [Streptomyces sp. BPTC-684]